MTRDTHKDALATEQRVQKLGRGHVAELKQCFSCLSLRYKPFQVSDVTQPFISLFFRCSGISERLSCGAFSALPGLSWGGRGQGFVSTVGSLVRRVAPGCSLASPHNVSFSKASLRGLGSWRC